MPEEIASTPPPRSSDLARIGGFLLAIPLFALGISTLWFPASQLLVTAVQHPSWSGSFLATNWIKVLGYTMLVSAIRLIACILPLIFASSLAYAGSAGRHIGRTLFLFFALLVGPVSFGVSCLLLRSNWLSNPFVVQLSSISAEAFLTTTASTAIALWFFPGLHLATESKKGEILRPWLVLATVFLLGVLASGFQSLILPLTGFASLASGTTTLALLSYTEGMMAVPSFFGALIQLGIVGILGTLGGILLVAFNFRFELSQTSTTPRQPVGGSVSAISGLILLLIAVVAFGPILACILGIGSPVKGSAFTAAAPELLTRLTPGIEHQLFFVVAWFVLVLPVTYFGALGIGGIRPLGRHSEWLLAPFFPFFFISIATLWPAFFDFLSRAHAFGNQAVLIYPLLVNVAFLIFMTLYFKGQRERWISSGSPSSFFRAVVLPSIPVTATFAVATSVFVVRDALWQLISSAHNDNLAQVLVDTVAELDMSGVGGVVLIFTTGSVLAFFPILAILQILIVDRIRVRVGAS